MAIFFFPQKTVLIALTCMYLNLHILLKKVTKKKVTLTVLDASSNYKLIIWLYKGVEDFGNSSVFS